MKLIQPIFAIENPILPNSASISADPYTYTNNVIQTIITIFIMVGVIYFIWHVVMSAYHMISSQGDPKKWEEAQKSLTYAIVGIIVVLSIFIILRFVGIVFGIHSLKNLQIIWPTFLTNE